MDLIGGDLKKLYLKFLCASFGSAFISSIYGLVDMEMVGITVRTALRQWL